MVGLAGSDGFRKVLTWKEFKGRDGHVEVFASEDDTLARLAGLIREYGPDFLATYNGDGFDLPFLAQRARKLGVPFALGADGTGIECRNGEARMTGLCHLDVYQFVKHVIGRSLETDSFTLDAVSHELLGERKHAFDYRDINATWEKGDLRDLCRYNLRDAELTLMLAERLLPNVTELVRVTGIIPYDSVRMAFSQHVENYLLRKAHAAGELAPNKPRGAESEERSGRRAVGAFVLEPTPGFYERIAVFDFRSLYPSIIASHNISPGTMNCQCCKGLKNGVPGFDRWFCTKRRGFLSGVIEDLIRLRAEVKKRLKQRKDDPLLAARSEALKVLANSFYGYLGFPMARWYCFECLESVTAFGRSYIHKVIDDARKAGFQVLYSDTDSIFMLLGDKDIDRARAFAAYVNEELPGLMELDFEGHYPAGLFVAVKGREAGAKKRYALIDESGRLKIRGFETVRRNTSAVARELQHRILELLLKGKTQEAVAEVRQTVASLREHTLPLSAVVITTMLQKQTGAYAVKGPHVAAAERLLAQGIEVGPGTLINFIVVQGKGKISGRVRLPEEARQEEYDAGYYIENQVIPAVERIFATVGVSQEDLLGGADGKVAKQQTLAGF
jgi:DNA polymerase elongation subunit (family B)